jgi:hypothetical protein
MVFMFLLNGESIFNYDLIVKFLFVCQCILKASYCHRSEKNMESTALNTEQIQEAKREQGPWPKEAERWPSADNPQQAGRPLQPAV